MSISTVLATLYKRKIKLKLWWRRRVPAQFQSGTLGIIVGAGLLLFGIVVLSGWFQATRQGGEVSGSHEVTTSTDEPDETPVKNYTVAADQPWQIVVPSISVKGYIQKVGDDQQNAIAVPSNVHMAGWYTASPKPGVKGVSIIDGHVQGRYADGVFKQLRKVKKDDNITVLYGDRSERTFTVVQTDELTVAQASSEQYVNVTGTDTQLTLITCGGPYDRTTKQYSKRVLVRAALR